MKLCIARRRASAPTVWLFAALLLLGAGPAAAYDWTFGDFDVTFDTRLSFGVQLRTQSPDHKNYCTTIGAINALGVPPVVPTGAGNGRGANGDCGKSAGNLNYNKWAPTSTILKGLHELDVEYKNYSALIRFHWWYDGINQNGDRARTELTTEAKWQTGAGIQLLDAYLQGNWFPADIPVSVKFGNVVLNWGESTFLQNSLNVINPIDVRKLRVPGAELREALLAVPMVWGSVSPTDNLTVEGFYQFWWQETVIDPPGTYFSTSDALGPGGQFFDISTGHNDADINPLVPFPPIPPIGLGLLGVRQDGTVGPTAVIRGPNREARDQGQYGFAARYFIPQLAGAEVGAYFIHFHSRLPIISGQYSENAAQAAAAVAGQGLPVNPVTVGRRVLNGTRAVQFYPEDINKVGLSWSTAIDAISVALQGDFSYTIDQPLQLSEIQLLAGLFDSAGITAGTAAPGVPTVAPGQFFSGAVNKDVVTVQATATYVGEPGRVIGDWLGADQFVLAAEMGYLRVVDFDEWWYLPLQGSVTPQAVFKGNTANQFSSFGSRNSMGYVIRAALPYNNLFWGVNVRPFIGWAHGIWGVTPAPLLNYAQGSMAANIGVRFVYRNALAATVGYTNFFGGGDDNPRNDRDFLSFDIRYAF
jgi:hypothetical protein